MVEQEPPVEPEPVPREENVYGISPDYFELNEKDRDLYEKYE